VIGQLLRFVAFIVRLSLLPGVTHWQPMLKNLAGLDTQQV